MQAVREWLRRDPGVALLMLALVAATVLYAPTLSRGLVNYDDTWLVRDNYLLRDVSLRTLLFDTSAETRFVLGAEYLPVRDLSIALDLAVWGEFYPGFHITNLVLYLVAIALWFAVLVELGIDRTVAGLAILLWALHPAHAESVAWISERKGLLGIVFAGVAGLGYARFRIGRHGGWLALAMVGAVLAVWSKAPAAFSIAVFAGLELVVPARRVSWRRSLTGIGAMALVGAAAFVPVAITAMNLRVIGGDGPAPAGWLAMVLGLHGFYLELGAMIVPNAISYPVSVHGPSVLEVMIGAVGLIAIIATLVIRRGRLRSPDAVRVAALIWIFGWLPVSRLVMPMSALLVADRYLLFSSLGIALAGAVGLLAIRPSRARTALIVVVVVAAGLRTLDAQSNWRDSVTLWQRAVASNPSDGTAWSFYAESLEDAGDRSRAYEVLAEGLRHSRAPRLLLRKALLTLARGQRPDALRTMREAAEAGEPRAMVNLALLLAQDGDLIGGYAWARQATTTAPMYVKGFRTFGTMAFALKRHDEAVVAFQRVYAMTPNDFENRVDLARTLIALGRPAEARPHLIASVDDPRVGARASALLARLPQQ